MEARERGLLSLSCPKFAKTVATCHIIIHPASNSFVNGFVPPPPENAAGGIMFLGCPCVCTSVRHERLWTRYVLQTAWKNFTKFTTWEQR